MAKHNWWDGSQNKSGQLTLKDSYADSRGHIITFVPLIAGAAAGAQFDPFITNYSDTWTSDWSSEHVFGRSDPIYTWKSTGRAISLGFKTVAASVKEAYTNMSNIQALQKMLYPFYYTPGSGMATTVAKAPLIRIRWANLIMNSKNAHVYPVATDGSAGNYDWAHEHGLLGVIKSLSCTPDLDEGMIEGPGYGMLYPKVWNVSISFNVLHENVLGWQSGYDVRAFEEGDDPGEAVATEAGGMTPYNRNIRWIGEGSFMTGVGDESHYPYGIGSTGIDDVQAAAAANAPDSSTPPTADSTPTDTGSTPDKDALIDEAEIKQESLSSFYSRRDYDRGNREVHPPDDDPFSNPLPSRTRRRTSGDRDTPVGY